MAKPLTLAVAILTISSFLFTGCSSFQPFANKQLPVGKTPVAPEGQFIVEMHKNFGAPKLVQLPVTENMTIQNVLEQSGAIENYRTMDVTLYRRVSETGRLLRMPIDYDTRNDQVRLEQDYAVHPNDRVVIKPKSSSPLEKVVNGLFNNG